MLPWPPNLAPQALVVGKRDEEQRLRENDTDFMPSSAMTSDDPVYATLTSGSIGNLRGVVIHHAGFTANILTHEELYQLEPHSRGLQFSSAGFDACFFGNLSALMMGGCVCIPTASDFHDRLGEAINTSGVTVACLTPTVAQILSPSNFPTMEAVVSIGEAVLASDVARWGAIYAGPISCPAQKYIYLLILFFLFFLPSTCKSINEELHRPVNREDTAPLDAGPSSACSRFFRARILLIYSRPGKGC